MQKKFNLLVSVWMLLGLLGAGCGQPKPQESAPETNDPPIASLPRLLVVANDPLADAIRREWRARTGAELDVRTMDEVAWQQLISGERSLTAITDAVIYPTLYVGSLTEFNQILPAPEYVFAPTGDEEDLLAEADILPGIRQTEVRWGGKWMAIPFSSAPLLLVYRADLLQQYSVEIPRTWAALRQSATKLREHQLAGELPESVSAVIAQPLSPGWAARNLLARVASSIRDPRKYSDVFTLTSMEPRIDSAPFVRALEELIADQQWSADPAARMTPGEVYTAVRDGRAVIGIAGWPVARGKPGAGGALPLLGFALLPGAWELYSESDNAWADRNEVLQVPLLAAGGSVGSVVHGTRRQRVAWNLLRQLASPEWSAAIGPAGRMAAPFRESHLSELRPWLGEDLADESIAQLRSGLREYYAADVTMTVLRIPYAAEYLKVLDEAVVAALEGRVTAPAALSEAARQWSQLVERHGRNRQAEAYLRGFSVLE